MASAPGDELAAAAAAPIPPASAEEDAFLEEASHEHFATAAGATETAQQQAGDDVSAPSRNLTDQINALPSPTSEADPPTDGMRALTVNEEGGEEETRTHDATVSIESTEEFDGLSAGPSDNPRKRYLFETEVFDRLDRIGPIGNPEREAKKMEAIAMLREKATTIEFMGPNHTARLIDKLLNEGKPNVISPTDTEQPNGNGDRPMKIAFTIQLRRSILDSGPPASNDRTVKLAEIESKLITDRASIAFMTVDEVDQLRQDLRAEFANAGHETLGTVHERAEGGREWMVVAVLKWRTPVAPRLRQPTPNAFTRAPTIATSTT